VRGARAIVVALTVGDAPGEIVIGAVARAER
jgi:hypothetical protein